MFPSWWKVEEFLGMITYFSFLFMYEVLNQISILFSKQSYWINAKYPKYFLIKMMLIQKISPSFFMFFVRRNKRKEKVLYIFHLWYWKFTQGISAWLSAAEQHFSQSEDWCQPTIKIMKICQIPQLQLPLLSNRRMHRWNSNKESTTAVFTKVNCTWRKPLEWDVEWPNHLCQGVTSGQTEIQTSC